MKKTYVNKISINNGTAETPYHYRIKTEVPFSIAELQDICKKAIEKADKKRMAEIKEYQ